jgi:hypothetical protein
MKTMMTNWLKDRVLLQGTLTILDLVHIDVQAIRLNASADVWVSWEHKSAHLVIPVLGDFSIRWLHSYPEE